LKLFSVIGTILLLVTNPLFASSDLTQIVEGLKGSAVQGGMVWGTANPDHKLYLDGAEVKIGPNGNFVFGFGRDAGKQATLRLLSLDGTATDQLISVATRKFNIERVDGLPPKTVTPPKSWLARRKIENGRVRTARAENTNAVAWLGGFQKPAEGRFSGFYGSQRILNGKPRSPHYGLDIAAPSGQPIYAPAGGIIRLAAADFLLEGGIVIIDHGFGVSSTLFHMNSVDVKEGDAVVQGAKIGTIGSKGRASGPHVDWRINWGTVRLDPLLLIGKDETTKD